MARFKLRTDAEYRAAKAPEGGRLEIRDNDPTAAGLALRVSERGHKAWSLRYRLADGTMRRITLGDFPAVTVADARDLARARKKDAAAGGDPQADKRRARHAARVEPIRTFADLATTYFRACELGRWTPRKKRKAPSTIAEERALYRRHIEAHLGPERPEDITRHAIRQRLETIAEAAPIQANRALSLLRQIFNFAVVRDRLKASPMGGVEALAAEKARERTLTDAELKALWSALCDPSGLRQSDPPVYVGRAVCIALQLAALLLQRRGEVAGMARAELDLDQALWIIPGERTKNRRPHAVQLPPLAVDLLREALELAGNSPFVFPSPRPIRKEDGNEPQPITPAAMSHALRGIYGAIGIDGATLHDLRRTGASVMASERLTVAPHVISRVLNHIDDGGAARVTARHYALYDYAAEKRSALERWAALLSSIAEGRARESNVVAFTGGAA